LGRSMSVMPVLHPMISRLSRFRARLSSGGLRIKNGMGMTALLLGVAGASLPAQSGGTGAVQETSAVTARGQIDPLSLPVTPIRELLDLAPGRLPSDLVRVQASALPHRARDIIEVTDGTGTLMVQSRQPNRLPAGERHDFVGRARMRAGQLIMDDAQFTLVRRIPVTLSDDAFLS
jgi:hypothetical protein